MTDPRNTTQQHRLLDEARRAAIGKSETTAERLEEAKRDVLLHGYKLFSNLPFATRRPGVSLAILGALILTAVIVAIAV